MPLPSSSAPIRAPLDDARREKIYLVLLLSLVILAFSPSLRGGYVFDDEILVVRNAAVHELSLSGLRHAFSHATFESASGPKLISYYRPLVMASYAFDYALGGGNPLPFRLTNLFLHLASTVLVFRMLVRYAKSPDWAALATAWFALHPARAESVAWISGRPDPLCLVFLLLATWVVGSRLKVGAKIALFGGFGVLAFLSKEMAVVFPLFVLAELIFGGVASSRALRSPWFLGASALALAYGIFRVRFLPLEGAALPWDVVTRIGFVLATLGRELSILFVPLDLSLHGASLTTIGRVDRYPPLWAALGGVALLVGIGATVFFFRRGRTVLAVALGLAFFSLAPISNLLPMPGSVLSSPRLLYAPHVFFSLFLASLLSNGGAKPTARSLPLIGALAALLAVGCGFRSEAFTNNRAFWASEFEAHPDVPAAIAHVVRQDIASGKGEQGVVRALCGARFAEGKYPRSLATASVLVPGLEALAVVLPDSRRKELVEFREFVVSLASGNGGKLGRPFGIEIAPRTVLAREFLPYRAKLRVLALDTAVRLGEPDARTAIARELENAAREPGALEGLARVALRARDIETSDAFVARSPRAQSIRESLKFVRDLVETSEARIAASEGKEKLLEELRLTSSLGLFAETLRLGRVAFGERFENLELESPLGPVLVESALHAADASSLDALGKKFGTVLPEKEELAKTLVALEKDLEPGGCRFSFDAR